MNRLTKFLAPLAGALVVCVSSYAQDKVVYHIDNAETQATKGCVISEST